MLRIDVPPFAQRPDDIADLARHFWARAAVRVGSRAVLGPDALAAFARYDWPGNVRELQNALAALAVGAPARGIVRASALPAQIRIAEPGVILTLDEARRRFEAGFVRAAIARAGRLEGTGRCGSRRDATGTGQAARSARPGRRNSRSLNARKGKRKEDQARRHRGPSPAESRGDADAGFLVRSALPADRQHSGLLAARRGHDASGHRLPVVGRAGLLGQIPLGAADRSRGRSRSSGASAVGAAG